MWVTPVTSPAAHTRPAAGPVPVTRQVAVVGSAAPGVTVMPSAPRPRPDSLGRRPEASSSRSASIRVPSSSASVRPSALRSALVAAEPTQISAPARRSAAASISPAKAGSPGSSPGSASTSVTCEPNAA